MARFFGPVSWLPATLPGVRAVQRWMRRNLGDCQFASPSNGRSAPHGAPTNGILFEILDRVGGASIGWMRLAPRIQAKMRPGFHLASNGWLRGAMRIQVECRRGQQCRRAGGSWSGGRRAWECEKCRRKARVVGSAADSENLRGRERGKALSWRRKVVDAQ